jgi:hypothetical protein
MYFSNMLRSPSVSFPFHPLPEPVCQFAISFSYRACLFSLVHKPVCQHAKIYSSIAFKGKQKMLSEISDFFILMQKWVSFDSKRKL